MCLRLKQSNLVWLQVDVAIQTDSARVAATKAYHNGAKKLEEVEFELFTTNSTKIILKIRRF